MKRTRTTYKQIDELLTSFLGDEERYIDGSRKLALRMNADGEDIFLPDSDSWRGPKKRVTQRKVASIEEQLRTEIDCIETMSREDEARLARRIEFARLRLDLALEGAGLDRSDLEGAMHYEPSTFRAIQPEECKIPADVGRRWLELHSMRTELVERNLYLVLINVERYSHLPVSRLDLIQEGSASLFRAVDGFDWRRGLLFRTYAVHWLNQAFRSFLYNFGSTVRVPVYLQKAMKHVKRAIERLGDNSVSAEQIASEADLGVGLVESALTASRSTLSMDAPIGGKDEGTGLGDVLAKAGTAEVYSTDMEEVSLHEGISLAIERLSEREKLVIRMRFGLDDVDGEHTLSEVAKELGVSLERIRQIQVRAINKMKTPGLRKATAPFLGV
ncbi:MAG: RNA polymerase sigma factor (sigma-70 family) [Planctomycetota bacterium]